MSATQRFVAAVVAAAMGRARPLLGGSILVASALLPVTLFSNRMLLGSREPSTVRASRFVIESNDGSGKTELTMAGGVLIATLYGAGGRRMAELRLDAAPHLILADSAGKVVLQMGQASARHVVRNH